MDRKVLGQLNPAAATQSTLYTVPASTQTVISSIVVCNRSAIPATFRIRINVAGGADDNKQFIYYDQSVGGNSAFVATIGLTLNATDIVKVYASTANLSFNIFGEEIS